MEKTLRERQQDEALKRMAILKLLPNVIEDFKNGVVYYSERQNALFDGVLYWVSNNEEYEKILADFEKKHEALVYHAQLLHTSFGDMLTLLYVSKDPNEWQQDQEDLKDGVLFAYVANLDGGDYSEFGSVGIVPKNGGVSRTF